MESSKLKIKLIDFWPNARAEDTFFFKALAGSELSLKELRIYSVFPSRLITTLGGVGRILNNLRRRLLSRRLQAGKKISSVRNIWWTGENVRPPLEIAFDHFVSFDQDTYDGRNTYFPLFYLETLFPTKGGFERTGASVFLPSDLTKPRLQRPSQFTSRKFVCAFINNPEPIRMAALRELEKYGQVDVYGKHTGNVAPSKAIVAKDYKYMLCFENDFYPGYVTEKLLDAYLCGTVPLYWGNLGRENHINQKSFINLADFASLEEFSKHVAGLTEEQYMKVFGEPLLLSVPSAEPLLLALSGQNLSTRS